jgi:hypothetical protein
MDPLVQGAAKNILIWMADSTDHITGKTGLTLTCYLSKAAGGFGSMTVTVTERSYGWYQLALTASHTEAPGILAIHITATGADPTDYFNEVVAWIPKQPINPYATILKSTAKEFVFWVPDAANPSDGKTGLTDDDFGITISKNGGSFTSITSAVTVTEIDYGFYKFTLSSSHTDTDGDLALLISTNYDTPSDNGMVEMPFLCHVVSAGSSSIFFSVGNRGQYVDSETGYRWSSRRYGE